MPSWFNPRVAVVAVSIVVLMHVSNAAESAQPIRRDCIACIVLLLLYAIAFLLPLWRTLGAASVGFPGLTLCAAWLAVALALISDALPRTLAERMQHPFNWPMAFCCIAGSAAFLLFFQSVTRKLRLREEVIEARHTRGGKGL